MNYLLTRISGNGVTGPIPVTITGCQSCPDACPLKNRACYARQFPLALHWSRVSNGYSGYSIDTLCIHIRSLPRGALWKHNQAGDLPGVGNRLNIRELNAIVRANRGRRGFTYTHKPLYRENERRAVSRANESGFTINLSANSIIDADRLSSMGIAPVVCLLPEHIKQAIRTPSGRIVIVCPAKRGINTDCSRCGLCQIANRKFIIGFPMHGIYKKLYNP